MKEIILILYCSFCILGAVLGAGFLSGAEVYSFFTKFKIWGFVGIIVSSVLFAIFILIINRKNAKLSINNAKILSKPINYTSIFKNTDVKIENKNNKKFIKFMLMIFQIFMTAGMQSGLVIILNSCITSLIICNIIVFILLLVFLYIGVKGAGIINVVVCLVTIVLIPLILKVDFAYNEISTVTTLDGFGSLVFACFYMAMNIVACITLVNDVTSKVGYRRGREVAISSSIILAVLLIAISCCVLSVNTPSDMPIIDSISNPILKIIWTILSGVAMFSTMLSSGVGVKEYWGSSVFVVFILSCVCTIVSFIGFSNIIEFVYPVIGCCCCSYIVYTLLKNLRQKIKNSVKNNQKCKYDVK